jgi:Rieske Fe-S protein
MTHPNNPPPAATPGQPLPQRRNFLLWLTWFFGAVAALFVAIPFVAYLLGPLRRRPKEWVDLGPVSRYPLKETRLATFDNPLGQPWDGMTARTSVYVRYEGTDDTGAHKFVVFAENCAHLGCPVSWFPQSGLFMCPCHGGVYYEDGERASGPPPRGLFHCTWEVSKGHLMVRAPHLPTLQDTLDKPAKG